MAGNTPINEDALLKEYYTSDKLEIDLFEDNVFIGMVPKDESVEGREYVSAVVYGASQARSADFATALAMSALVSESVANFKVPYVSNHAIARISADLISQARTSEGAFMDAVTLIGDDVESNMMLDVAISAYRTSDGARGNISAGTTVASSTLTLANPLDILNFEIGMQLDLAAAQSSGNPRAYGSGSHGLYVVAVNYDTYSLTVGTTPATGGTPCNITDAVNGIPTASATSNTTYGDYIYVTGDRNAKMHGILDWIPYGGPTSALYCGLDRTPNPTRLAGRWMDGTTGANIASVLEDGIAQLTSTGGRPTHCFVTPKKFADFSKELGAKAQMVEVKSTNANVGYTGIEVAGTKGKVVVLPDRSVPSNRMLLLRLSSWEMISSGKIASIWQEDGKVWLRSYNAAGMEMRFYGQGNLRCKSPRDNMTIAVTP